MVAIIIWNFFDFLFYSTNSFENQMIWGKWLYTGACMVMPLLLVFFLQYPYESFRFNISTQASLFLIPLFSLASVFTNENHWLFWRAVLPASSYAPAEMVFIHGPIYWFDLGYNYICGLIIIIILIRNILVSKELYRFQFSILLVSSLFPFFAGLVFSFNWNPFPGLDILPVSFAVGAVGIIYSITNFRLLDLVPIARNAVIDTMEDAVIVIDQQQRILDINPSAKSLLGLKDKKAIGLDVMPLLQSWPGLIDILQKPSEASREISRDLENRKQNFHVQISCVNKCNGPEYGQVIVLRDISPIIFAQDMLYSQLSEIKVLQAELKEQAIRDPLTNLYNRRYLKEVLEHEFARAHHEGYPVSIMMADIDHFKEVNDTFGHPVGDIVLQFIADQLYTMCRPGDIVCRYGGEEFLLVLPNISYEIATVRAEQWRKALPEIPIPPSEMLVKITMSIGVAAFPSHGDTPEKIIIAADDALYQAKRKGRNRVVHRTG